MNRGRGRMEKKCKKAIEGERNKGKERRKEIKRMEGREWKRGKEEDKKRDSFSISGHQFAWYGSRLTISSHSHLLPL